MTTFSVEKQIFVSYVLSSDVAMARSLPGTVATLRSRPWKITTWVIAAPVGGEHGPRKEVPEQT